MYMYYMQFVPTQEIYIYYHTGTHVDTCTTLTWPSFFLSTVCVAAYMYVLIKKGRNVVGASARAVRGDVDQRRLKVKFYKAGIEFQNVI